MGLLSKLASLFTYTSGEPGYDITVAQQFVYERLPPEVQAKLTVSDISLLIAGVFDWLDSQASLKSDFKTYGLQQYLFGIVSGHVSTMLKGEELEQFKQAIRKLTSQELDDFIMIEKEYAIQNGTSRPS